MDKITIFTTKEHDYDDLEFEDVKLSKENINDQVMDISGDVEIEDFNQLLSAEQLKRLNECLKENTELGIMFYYGDSVSSKSSSQEMLLMHAIIGLENLQHKGSMVLKVGSLLDRASVDMVFTLYSLFKCAVICRPYLSSALKDYVFIVCKELVDKTRANQICQCLKKIYAQVLL